MPTNYYTIYNYIHCKQYNRLRPEINGHLQMTHWKIQEWIVWY